MKALFFIIFSMTTAISLSANTEKTIASKIQHVTVYTTGAEVSRTAAFQADKGLTELVFSKVSPYVNSRSIQVNGKGDFVILDVKYRVKQPEPVLPEETPLPPAIVKHIELLMDSLTQVNFGLEDLQNRKDFLLLEKNVLLGNKYMKGQLDTITQLQFAMDYLRKQLNDINEALMKIKREEFVMTKTRNGMQERLTALQSYNAKVNPIEPEQPDYQVVVTISADVFISGTLNVSYMVSNAGWSPLYDIRAGAAGQPVELVCKANVYQNTGEDWKNSRLKLSTITPSQGYAKPALPVLYAAYYQPVRYHNLNEVAIVSQTDSKGKREADMATVYDESGSGSSADFTQASYTLTNIEYDISLPYTIPADGQPHLVAVLNKKLDAEFYHYLVPRIDKQAYLVARIPDWGTLDLLPGIANIYFEGSYVGETNINTGIMADTLELALGKDRSIIVERTKDKDEVKNALMGDNVIRSITYNIKVRNNKLLASNVVIEDQVPMTNTADIKVKDVACGSAAYSDKTGMLTWKLKLASKESKTLSFSYSIEHDKNRPLANIY